MPRVDRGSLALEVSHVLKLESSRLLRLVESLLSVGGLLVVRPSIVSIESSRGPVLVALGVGSVVLARDPGLGIPLYTISRPEWVEGCIIGQGDPLYVKPKRATGEVEGMVEAREILDPAASLVNGLKGRIVLGDLDHYDENSALASVGGEPILYYYEHGYASRALEGEAARRLDYIAPLASSCNKAMN